MAINNNEKKYASTGKRIGAGLIDLGICLVIGVIATALFGERQVVYGNDMVTYAAHLNGIPLVMFWVLLLAYFVVAEKVFGATIGKYTVHIRVTAQHGNLTWGQSFIRNAMRVIDAFPFFFPYLLGFVCILSNKKRQRIGDMAAKTVVIEKAE